MDIRQSIVKRCRALGHRFELHLLEGAGATELKGFLQTAHPYKTDIELIRIGGDDDGGYLLPNDLAGVQSCFSAGVGPASSFETHLATLGISSFMADYSVEKPPVENKFFHFEKKFIGAIANDQYMTMESWVKKNSEPTDHNLILQMDIEGAEYEAILSCSREILQRFRIVVIEFHHLDLLAGASTIQFLRTTFNKILTDFEIVHIHPNNFAKVISYKSMEIPSTMEFTFLRKDRILNKTPAKKFPHPLDLPNSPIHKEIILPSCWYQ